MKLFLVVVMFFNVVISYAGEFDGYDPKYKDRIQKMSSFITEKGKCYAATFMIAKQSVKTFVPSWAESVICAINMTFDPGGMKEKYGCTLMVYSPDTDQYRPLNKLPFEIPFVQKTCGSGGFEELMNKMDIWYPVGSNKAFPAKNLLFRAAGIPRDKINVHIISAKNEKVRSYMEKEIKVKE